MSTNPAFGTRPNTQEAIFDNLAIRYPGQLDEGLSYFSLGIRGFPAQNDVYCGRAVIKGATIDPVTGEYVNLGQPFKVTPPVGASVSADIFGVVIRTRGGLETLLADPTDTASLRVAGVRENQGASIAELQSDIVIGVEIPIGVTIADGTAVYVAVNAVNDANVFVGEFMDDSPGTTGMVLVPGAVYYGTFESTVGNQAGRIKLAHV